MPGHLPYAQQLCSGQINIFRGIILRGAGFPQLWLDGLVLAIMGVGVLLLAARKFERMVV